MTINDLLQTINEGRFKRVTLCQARLGGFLLCVLSDGRTIKYSLSTQDMNAIRKILVEKGLLREYATAGPHTLLTYEPKPW